MPQAETVQVRRGRRRQDETATAGGVGEDHASQERARVPGPPRADEEIRGTIGGEKVLLRFRRAMDAILPRTMAEGSNNLSYYSKNTFVVTLC